jgi:hypothetical protein
VLELGRLYLPGLFFMAAEAKCHLLRPFPQKLFEVRRMGGMTASTLAFAYRLVRKLGLFNLGNLIRISLFAPVAVGADGELGPGQEELVYLGTVRVMAIGAPLFNWFMYKSGLTKESLLLFVAT